MQDSETGTEDSETGSKVRDSDETDTPEPPADQPIPDELTSDETAAAERTDEDDDGPVPARQSAALRRQQLTVGAVGIVMVALAVVASLFQQFPSLPVPVVLLAALLVGLGMGWLVAKSIFPGEDESFEE